jgi:hypothetical protein
MSTFKILVFGDIIIRKTDDLKYNGSAKRGKSTNKMTEKRTTLREIHLKCPVFFHMPFKIHMFLPV